jgi:membrane-associated phospholipid phosphatase
MSLYGVGFAIQWVWWGLPVDTLLIFVWLLAAAVCWNIGKPLRHHIGWFRDWGPILGLLLVYNISRGFADNAGKPHVTEMISVDKFLFGGHVPTAWLQQHFYDRHHVHWWDVAVSFIYMSHFVLSLALAIVLWLNRRALWAAFMRRWFVLTALGLVTYFLYPAAPPWYASFHGVLHEPINRISTRGWSAIGLSGTGSLLNNAQELSNPVAAMPSLHAASALLIALFLIGVLRKKWRFLFLLYPLSMALTLVYSGEHYVTDVLVGWAYVGITWFGVSAAERWWRIRRARVAAPTSPVVGETPSSTSHPPPPGDCEPAKATARSVPEAV